MTLLPSTAQLNKRNITMMQKYIFSFLVLFSTSQCVWSLELNASIPNCQLQNLTNNQNLTLSHPGKVVIVDFWASWCGPCAQSIPFLNSLKARYADKIEIIGVNVDEEINDAHAFVAKHKPLFTLGRGEDQQCPVLFDVKTMPSTYYFDQKGQLQFVEVGFFADKTDAVLNKLNQLLK